MTRVIMVLDYVCCFPGAVCSVDRVDGGESYLSDGLGYNLNSAV